MHADTRRCTFSVDSQFVDLAAEVFSLLADATRLRIILLLSRGERSVGDLAESLQRSPASVSQHLAKLRWGRVVETRQAGTRVYYRLVDEHAKALVTQAVFQAQHVLGGVPEHHRAGDGRITAESGAGVEQDRAAVGRQETAGERPGEQQA